MGKLDTVITAPKTVGNNDYLDSYIASKKLSKDEIDILYRCFEKDR